MKKNYIIILLFILINAVFFSVNFDIGMSFLTGENNWNMALRLGLEEENFAFSSDITYVSTPNFSFITIMDVSTSILKINDNSYVNFGIAWFNDRITDEATQNRSIFLMYSGLNLSIKNLALKFGFGYPLSQKEYSNNLSDYMFFKITYIVPPPEDFIDDLKIEFRFLNGRKDFSLYFSEPIK
ncbi:MULTISPECIES: hypothetical protein [unclassified Marinitoga]|uniref:hypothetical protein n=1 Tax=unclassified Marinitoga TaxID=2640159 RepID=UPI0006413A30|nr:MULTISPECIES: hypothetical protein [unclassified Marinitoga]KLO23706.1 hypothetical protein X274_05835 [Marinitoga sp. 1155]NUV00138.1 hypothetical protein [Marinitoga sp. 1154]